jgi:hypothetical protein
MTERNVSPRTKTSAIPPGAPLGTPVGAPTGAPTGAPLGAPRAEISLGTPLVWAWGGVLLTATTWLGGVIALFRSVGGLFD